MSEHESPDAREGRRRLPKWLGGYQIFTPLVLILLLFGLLALIYFIAL